MLSQRLQNVSVIFPDFKPPAIYIERTQLFNPHHQLQADNHTKKEYIQPVLQIVAST